MSIETAGIHSSSQSIRPVNLFISIPYLLKIGNLIIRLKNVGKEQFVSGEVDNCFETVRKEDISLMAPMQGDASCFTQISDLGQKRCGPK